MNLGNAKLGSQQTTATGSLLDLLRANREGRRNGIYSICSANRFVLEAGVEQARRDASILLIESTSNQVNQFGGYTGQTPAQFAEYVREIAASMNFPFDRIALGGDHLGPHVWRAESAPAAMQKACQLVRDCVLAGYTKIHLDASMHLQGDPGDPRRALDDAIVSERAAELCRAAEQAHQELPEGSPEPIYIIGTEVPIPGGELADSLAPEVTRTGDVARTLESARDAFRKRGLLRAWERVVGIVVQPGVEFGDSTVVPFDPSKAHDLAEFVVRNWHGVYEAHSTDYQSAAALAQLVEHHFAILKVGPWLTYAFREAVFALAEIEATTLSNQSGVQLSRLRETLDAAMSANPAYWKGYTRQDRPDWRAALMQSYSDRVRYYWPQPDVASALALLIANLREHPAPASLVARHFPEAQGASSAASPEALIRGRILRVMDIYADACGLRANLG